MIARGIVRHSEAKPKNLMLVYKIPPRPAFGMTMVLYLRSTSGIGKLLQNKRTAKYQTMKQIAIRIRMTSLWMRQTWKKTRKANLY
jgi:hypothetical protein